MEKLYKSELSKVLIVVILFALFILLCKYANTQSFWFDELDWTIEYLAKSSNIINLIKSLIKSGFNMPLFYLILFPIYKIAPYGELWLLIPNFIAVIIGIYILNKIGNKLGNQFGKYLGFASICMAATSYTLIEQCAIEFRPYALLFGLSDYTLYRFICKEQEPQKQTNTILYTLSIICLSFTHWFGCLIVAFYFLFDLYLWLRKKNKIAFIIPYISLGIIFLPYFIILMLYHTSDFSNYWANIPTLKHLLYDVFFFLSSNNYISLLLFILGFTFLLYCLINNKVRNIDTNFIFIIIGSVIWTLGAIFIYSRFINPNGSLWVPRYFTVLLPHIFIITAIPIAKLLESLDTIYKKDSKITIKIILIILILILIICLVACLNFKKLHDFRNSIVNPYREVSNFVSNTPNLYEESSVLITSRGKTYITYYFEKKGVKLPNNILEAHYYCGSPQDYLTKCVSEGKSVDSIHVDIQDLLRYDKLYLFQVIDDFKEYLLDFIDKNYDQYIINPELGLTLCIKK